MAPKTEAKKTPKTPTGPGPEVKKKGGTISLMFHGKHAWVIWLRALVQIDAKKEGIQAVKTERIDFQNGAGKNSLMLVPGLNVIPKEDWESIKDHIDVKFKLENNLLEVFAPKLLKDGVETAKVVENADKDVQTLDQLDVQAAIKLVDNTIGEDALEKLSTWRKAERRPPVLNAITAMIKKITGA
jgi:hypothetical protein